MTIGASPSTPAARLADAFCLVPAGPFIYGPERCYERLEGCRALQPQQTLELPAFAIGRLPVTNEAWRRFLTATGYRWPGRWYRVARGWRRVWRRAYEPVSEYPEAHARWPVVEVSQADARAYCSWLSDELDRPCTLPTEVQWEKAARGIDGRLYPWGDDRPRPELQWQRRFPVGPESFLFSLVVPARAEWARAGWYWRNGYPRAVGHEPRNVSPYGCIDMSGNIWEWTSSRFDPGDDRFHVVKGGSWGYSVHHTCSNVRSACSLTIPSADYRAQGTGFRVLTEPW